MKKTLLFMILIISAIGLIACGSSLNDDKAGNANSTEDLRGDQVEENADAAEPNDQVPNFVEEKEAVIAELEANDFTTNQAGSICI